MSRKESAWKENYETKGFWLLTYLFFSSIFFKSFLIQISKSPYVCCHLKQYSVSFPFLIHIILELFTHTFCTFLKKSDLFFGIFYCVCMFPNKHFVFSKMCIPQNIKIVLMWSLRQIFYEKTVISTDFEICIKVKSLTINNNNKTLQKNPCFVFKFQEIRNLSNTFMTTNKVYANLTIANSLRKQICRTLISAIQK